jgi:hypothetical protein
MGAPESSMDEGRTLAILGWTLGGLIGAMFILNGIALSSMPNEPERVAKQNIAPQNTPVVDSSMSFVVKRRGG